MSGPEIDAELILLLARLWRELGLSGVTLELNSLGTAQARARFRTKLVDYLHENAALLDADSERRLLTNPLRVLDSKNPAMQEMIAGAPRLADELDDDCQRHFERLKSILSCAGVEFVVNPRLVRGLDYYSRTVFEWTTDQLGAQGTVCGGGRYDGLAEQLGGPATPGVGFSVGVERLVELLQGAETKAHARTPDAYLMALGDAPAEAAHPVAERLRSAVRQVALTVDAEPGSVKAKFRRADRSGAHYALILGDDELAAGTLTVKPLRNANQEQRQLSIEEVAAQLATVSREGRDA